MSSYRKRSSVKKEETFLEPTLEEEGISNFSETLASEIIEQVEQEETVVFIEPEIVPTEHIVKTQETVSFKPKRLGKPKRNLRNTPRFSQTVK